VLLDKTVVPAAGSPASAKGRAGRKAVEPEGGVDEQSASDKDEEKDVDGDEEEKSSADASGDDDWTFYTTPLSRLADPGAGEGEGRAVPLTACLADFMSVERLEGSNRFGCDHCNRAAAVATRKSASSEL